VQEAKSMIWAIHNSQDLFYRNPFGAAQEQKEITLRIKLKDKAVKNVYIRLWRSDSEEKVRMEKECSLEEWDVYKGEINSGNSGLLWYYFIIEKEDGIWFYCNRDDNMGGVGVLKESPLNSYQITVYKKDFTTPEWLKEGIMYQIFVDRFCNGNESGEANTREDEYTLHYCWDEVPDYKPDYTGVYRANDFYGGNLKGIIKKLPYLKELGVSIIYLNPIFKAFSNHKYDTGDYEQIDPMYGDNNTFIELCHIASKHGISIILDGVFSHTGCNSRYFNKEGRYDSLGAYQSMDSPYYPWYSFKNFPDKYECWWGFPTLPNADEENESYKEYILTAKDSIIKRWLSLGASGWRLDVADELPESFIKELRLQVKGQNKDAAIIGEVWEDASNKLSYGVQRQYLCGDELDTAMNYPFRDMLIDFLLGKEDAEKFNIRIMNLYENYPIESLYSAMNLIGSHDVPRILTILGGALDNESLSTEEKSTFRLDDFQRELGEKKLKLASLMQLTFPGVPCIYYGDEAGMEGYRDPFNRGTYPWGKENPRLLSWYKKLAYLRSSSDMLKTGTFIPVYASEDVYAYVRVIEKCRDAFGKRKKDGFALVVVNRSLQDEKIITLDLSGFRGLKSIRDVVSGRSQKAETATKIIIKPLSGRLFIGEFE
jgi:4-alpha-glucanotransferase